MTIDWTAGAARIACVLIVLIGPASADDADQPPARLACTFTSGTSVTYESGKFASKPASDLTFSISQIDLDGQSAALTAEQGKSPVPVRIVRTVHRHLLRIALVTKAVDGPSHFSRARDNCTTRGRGHRAWRAVE